MKRPILLHPDPRLKKVCAPVPDLTDELRALASDMLETMYDAPGIGLAAPQVGVMSRLIEVLESSADRNVYEEGCLSIPDQYADVERPAEVRVSWVDETGTPREEEFDGLWATCVQHEIDHLDGKLFIDYLKPLKRQLITRKMVKLKRDRARV